MVDLQTALVNLSNLGAYIASFPQEQQAARFEYLGCESFSYMLKLPFYNGDNDDNSIKHRVLWRGSKAKWANAPAGPDGVIFAYGFYVLLEATLLTGRSQWSREFSPCVDHYEAFLKEVGLERGDCYLGMLLTEVNHHTYNSIKQKVIEKCRFVLLPVSILIRILETYKLAFTATNSDLRLLLVDILDCCERSTDLEDFLQRTSDAVDLWRSVLLDRESRIFVGAKSYKALYKLGGHGSVSEVFSDLYDDSVVTNYFIALGRKLTATEIEISLEQERLAYRASKVPGDILYVPIPFHDVKGRVKIIIKELEDVVTSQ